MRKLLLFTFIVITNSIFCQKHFLGLKAGVAGTNISSKFETGVSKYKIGFNGGLSYEYRSDGLFLFGVDAIYAQKGNRDDLSLLMDGNDGRLIAYNFDYVSLPIYVGLSIGNELSGFFKLGIAPSYLARIHVEPYKGLILDEKEGYTQFDLSGIVEGGASYQLENNMLLSMSLAYQQSFTFAKLPGYYYLSDEALHHGFILSLSVMFAL